MIMQYTCNTMTINPHKHTQTHTHTHTHMFRGKKMHELHLESIKEGVWLCGLKCGEKRIGKERDEEGWRGEEKMGAINGVR